MHFSSSSRLTHLNLSSCSSDEEHPTNLRNLQWPPQLRKLTFGFDWHSPLSAAEWTPPATLVELQLPASIRFAARPIAALLLPPQLEVLHASQRWQTSLRALPLPSTLREFHFGMFWNLPIEALPLPLEALKFGQWFDQPIQALQLPSSLRSLAFGYDFNQPVAALHLPSSLCSLSFGKELNEPLHQLQLPKGLRSFTIKNAAWMLSKVDRSFSQLPRLPAGLRLLEAPRALLDGALSRLGLPPRCVVSAL